MLHMSSLVPRPAFSILAHKNAGGVCKQIVLTGFDHIGSWSQLMSCSRLSIMRRPPDLTRSHLVDDSALIFMHVVLWRKITSG